MERPTPTSLDHDGDHLIVGWRGGGEHRIPARVLRLACPCANCVDEGTGQRKTDPSSVPEKLRILRLSGVGRYAVSPTFSDSHATGIFPWDYLWHLGEGGAPKGAE